MRIRTIVYRPVGIEDEEINVLSFTVYSKRRETLEVCINGIFFSCNVGYDDSEHMTYFYHYGKRYYFDMEIFENE